MRLLKAMEVQAHVVDVVIAGFNVLQNLGKDLMDAYICCLNYFRPLKDLLLLVCFGPFHDTDNDNDNSFIFNHKHDKYYTKLAPALPIYGHRRGRPRARGTNGILSAAALRGRIY